MMFLVINAKEMVQTQTAECMVIGELLINRLIVCLNKIDIIPKEDRKAQIKKKKKVLKQVLSKTKFGKTVKIIPTAACVGANQEVNTS